MFNRNLSRTGGFALNGMQAIAKAMHLRGAGILLLAGISSNTLSHGLGLGHGIGLGDAICFGQAPLPTAPLPSAPLPSAPIPSTPSPGAVPPGSSFQAPFLPPPNSGSGLAPQALPAPNLTAPAGNPAELSLVPSEFSLGPANATGPAVPAIQATPISRSGSASNVQLPGFASGPIPNGPVQGPPSGIPMIGSPVAGQPPLGASKEEAFPAGRVICVVGDEYIFEGDMIVFVEPILEENRKKLTASQEKQLRTQLIRQVLKQYVEIKALYLEFFRDMTSGGAPTEIRETRRKITSKANKVFYEKQVPNLFTTYKVNNVKDLEEKLRSKSVSLNVLCSQFGERILGGELERKHVPEQVEISRDELIQYYEEHRSEWEKSGRARWRQLTARFDKYSSKEEARAAIVQMGNEVFLGGKPFEAVAKDKSQGFSASEGGTYDWTTQGSLKSKQLDASIFSIPVRRLSQVIEDDLGFHIIEVLEREDARVVPFEEAQADIRKAIKEQKLDVLRTAFRQSVMKRTKIWTRWPEDIPGSEPLPDYLMDIGVNSNSPKP